MYDVVVIGAGPGGYVAALRAAMRGNTGPKRKRSIENEESFN